MRSKERMTVTVDSELIEAANQAVSEGRVASLSGWVNVALAERAAKEQRLRTLAEAIGAYEAAFGEITSAELAAQERADLRNASAVRQRQSDTGDFRQRWPGADRDDSWNRSGVAPESERTPRLLDAALQRHKRRNRLQHRVARLDRGRDATRHDIQHRDVLGIDSM